MAEHSEIEIGTGSLLCSDAKATLLGVNHPIILRTVRPGAKILIGSGVRISGATICAAQEVAIGDRVVIGANAIIMDSDFHSLNPHDRSGKFDADKADVAPVYINEDAFIGAGVFILKGVCIGRGAVIGAGAIVNRNVPDFAIAMGNPVKIVGNLDISND